MTKDSSQKDIKLAYFRLAKKYHPDINTGPEARLIFQKLANAYEILGDEDDKRKYDMHNSSAWSGFSSDSQKTNNAYNEEYDSSSSSYDTTRGRTPEEIFKTVLQDISVIKEAAMLYGRDFGEDMKGLGSSLLKGDLKSAGHFISNNKVVLLGITVPLVIATRHPLALMLTGRYIFIWSQVAVKSLIISGQAYQAADWIWSRTVCLARARTDIEREREREQNSRSKQ